MQKNLRPDILTPVILLILCTHPIWPYTIKALSGIECFNGSTSPEANLEALRTARELGLARLGGSDAHKAERLGRFATRFDGPVRDESDLIRLIRARACEPVAWDGSSFVPAEAWVRSQGEE